MVIGVKKGDRVFIASRTDPIIPTQTRTPLKLKKKFWFHESFLCRNFDVIFTKEIDAP